MKQTEINFKELSRKEYRDKFCKELSLDVLRRAYVYSQNGHMPQSAISTAAVIYAEPLKQKPLLVQGIMAEKELNAVTVWSLQTETEPAQRSLLNGEWNFHNRAMCVARLGENYACTKLQLLEFPDELIIGVYQHRHRFVAVVSIENEVKSAISVPKVTDIANTMAKNAVAYYPEYLLAKKRQKHCRRLPLQKDKPEQMPDFKDFLLKRPLRFVEGINESYSFNCTRQEVSIAAYLEACSARLEQKLSLASVDVFGEF